MSTRRHPIRIRGGSAACSPRRSFAKRVSPHPVFLTLALCLWTLAAVHAQPATLRVMSYNIHHGEGLDKSVDLNRIADLIKREDVDLVALQEVDRGVKRTAGRDMPAELAELTGMNYHFEQNIPFQGGSYGNAFLTRLPIRKKSNTHFKMLREGEQRGLLQITVDVHGRSVLVMNTHLDHRPDDSERLINTVQIKRHVEAAGEVPVILCGDFNAEPGSRTHVKIKEFLSDTWELSGQGDGFTYPSDKPSKRIDYIWITKRSIVPLTSRTIPSDASDHLPLVAEFQIR